MLSEDHTIARIGNYKEILENKDLLIKTNIISELPHRHNEIIHKHITESFLFHSHNNENS